MKYKQSEIIPFSRFFFSTASGVAPAIASFANCLLGLGDIQTFNQDGKLYKFITAPGSGRYTGKIFPVGKIAKKTEGVRFC